MNGGGTIWTVFILLYLTPTIVAIFRNRSANVAQVITVNVLLGWTFVGWVVALVMASRSGREVRNGAS